MQKFDVSGMSCAVCAHKVESAVSKVDGVENCSVNLLTNSLVVEGKVNAEAVIYAVKNAGYTASLSNEKVLGKTAQKDEIKAIKTRLFTSLIFLTFLIYLSMGYEMWGFPLPNFLAESLLIRGIIQGALSLVIMFINRKFFINGVKGVIHLSPNMDTLVSLGSLASYLYSLVVLVLFGFNAIEKGSFHFYFESAGMILVLITVGKLLEAFSKGKTKNALQNLINLAPKFATLLDDDGKESVVSIDKIKVGDIVLIRSGESVTVDGVVISGESEVDESMLTGESLPVSKVKHSKVYTATVCVAGVMRVKTERVGEDTSLARIIKMVSDATGGKAPVQRLADKVSGIFVPAVLTIAFITTVIWLLIGQTFGYSLSRGISVLVISCPCALGLATPVAIMVGSGLGAKNGILFKTATDMEDLGKMNIVAFDKTGTITKGKPQVTDVISASGTSQEQIIKIAYSLEFNSSHPLGVAICDYAKSMGVSPLQTTCFKDIIGKGITAKIENENYYIGKVSFIEEKVKFDGELAKKVELLSSQGKTPMVVSTDNKILGIIFSQDTIKEDAIQTVASLKEMGITPVMITGDNQKTALQIANAVGIERTYSNVLPQEKGEIINQLKRQGKVCMVGDGINDAVALTVADTGLAIGSGTDVAINSGDVVLINSKLSDVLASIRLSKYTLKIIRENLFWAFIYNVLCIPLACGVFIPLGLTLEPIYGAGAMSLSSFFVIMNALRINLFDIYKTKKNKKDKKKGERKMVKTIYIEGMMCMHCEKSVKDALEKIDGVESVVANHTENKATVTLNKDVSNEILISAVTAKDYKVISIE